MGRECYRPFTAIGGVPQGRDMTSDRLPRPPLRLFPMKNILLCLALMLPATSPVAAAYREFDIVPSADQTVETVDGSTVLRQPGKAFGVVLTYRVYTQQRAWIPVAVLNSGEQPLAVGVSGLSITSEGKALEVFETDKVMRMYRRIRGKMRPSSGPINADMPSYSAGVQRARAATMAGPAQSPALVGEMRRRDNVLVNDAAPDSADDPTRAAPDAKERAEAEYSAMLLHDTTLAPGKLVMGDVLVELPKKRRNEPATFVLRLQFGGESLHVTYRERVAATDP